MRVRFASRKQLEVFLAFCAVFHLPPNDYMNAVCHPPPNDYMNAVFHPPPNDYMNAVSDSDLCLCKVSAVWGVQIVSTEKGRQVRLLRVALVFGLNLHPS